MTNRKTNIDTATVSSFGDEWSRFDQTGMSDSEAKKIFEEYFSVFPWDILPVNAEGFDMGCGTGRWARWVSPRVGRLHCIDPSSAIDIARRNLADLNNVTFHCASVGDQTLASSSQDFGYSLGVLHHVPDTEEAIHACVDLLKPGAPLLLYLYYALDNRSFLFRTIWRVSEISRRLICRMPARIKNLFSDIIAVTVYFPFAWLSRVLEVVGLDVSGIPLSYYRRHSFYTMRTDARDRFGTPLEQRFTKTCIKEMMERSGLTNILFSDSAPFWCVIGMKND